MTHFLAPLSRLSPLCALEMEQAIELLMDENAVSDAVAGAFLMATAVRKPTGEELAGAARAFRKHMVGIDPSLLPGCALLDTCGTGGSGQAKINVSTGAAFVCAAAGQPVAKHGNRSASGRCGSADVMQALGIRVDLSPERIAEMIRRINFGFLFAPKHHPAMKRVGAVRRELGVRTIFNFLGPLVNPFGATLQLVGVSDPALVRVVAEALKELGTKAAMVACAEDGLDEVSLVTDTTAVEVRDGELKAFNITPEALGLERQSCAPPGIQNPEDAAEHLLKVLKGDSNVYRDWVLANAGIALYVCGLASEPRSGVQLAAEVVDSGRAMDVLNAAREFSLS